MKEFDINEEIIDAEVIDSSSEINDRIKFNCPSIVISKSDIERADDNDNREISEKVKISDMANQFSDALESYNKKFDLNFKIETFKETIDFMANATSTQKELKKLIDSELVTNVVEVTIIKSILTLCYVLNSQLTILTNREHTEQFSVESMGSINMIFNWLENLDKLKEKYKIYRIDDKINSLKGLDKSDEEIKEEKNQTSDLIQRLLGTYKGT
jgi:hypothetical protein